jgi:hypothetical protein
VLLLVCKRRRQPSWKWRLIPRRRWMRRRTFLST